MADTNQLEEGTTLTLDFEKLAKVGDSHVIPCAVQNADTHEVILVAYVNDQALAKAIETRSAVFWSTSRNELWEKGKTSGETFDLLEVRVNCEQNSLVYIVRPRRGGKVKPLGILLHPLGLVADALDPEVFDQPDRPARVIARHMLATDERDHLSRWRWPSSSRAMPSKIFAVSGNSARSRSAYIR